MDFHSVGISYFGCFWPSLCGYVCVTHFLRAQGNTHNWSSRQHLTNGLHFSLLAAECWHRESQTLTLTLNTSMSSCSYLVSGNHCQVERQGVALSYTLHGYDQQRFALAQLLSLDLWVLWCSQVATSPIAVLRLKLCFWWIGSVAVRPGDRLLVKWHGHALLVVAGA